MSPRQKRKNLIIAAGIYDVYDERNNKEKVSGHLQVLTYHDKYYLELHGITFHEHNRIFRDFTYTNKYKSSFA